MTNIDRVLEDLQKEIELHGRSGGDTIYKTNVVFTISGRSFDVPSGANADEAIIDFEWFLETSYNHRVTAHPYPERSFWVRMFGANAEPYGYKWNLDALKKQLECAEGERRAVLFNQSGTDKPPCILSYQFQRVDHGALDCSIFMRSSDVAKVLPQDITMTRLLVKHVANMVGLKPGNMTFLIGNAHVFYKDCDFPEEYIYEFGL